MKSMFEDCSTKYMAISEAMVPTKILSKEVSNSILLATTTTTMVVSNPIFEAIAAVADSASIHVVVATTMTNFDPNI